MKRLAFAAVCALALSAVAHADTVPATSTSTASVGRDRVTQIQQQWDAGDKKGAQKAVKEWMKSEEKSPWPYLAAAGLSYRQKEWKKVRSNADAALKRDPNSADGYYWRGRFFEHKGKALDAGNEYRAALQVESTHPPANEGLARIRTRLGETDDGPRPN